MGTVVAVCTSRKKGTRKTPVPQATVDREFGLAGDAHASCTSHRQVSLLSTRSIQKMRALGLDVGPGDFAENLTIEGMELDAMPVGARLGAGPQVVLEITQIGKECHTRCAIYKQVGQCIMPTEGIFARVLIGGTVKPGDSIRVIGHEQRSDQGRNPDPGMQG